VRTGRDDVLASVYRGKNCSLVAVGSWAEETCDIVPSIDWEALGLDPEKATLYAPPILDFQPETTWKPGESMAIAPGRGWLLVLAEE